LDSALAVDHVADGLGSGPWTAGAVVEVGFKRALCREQGPANIRIAMRPLQNSCCPPAACVHNSGRAAGKPPVSTGVIMKLSYSLCGLAAAALLMPACATVTRGTKQKFVVETTPTAANIALSNGVTCVSPCKLKLKRKPGFDVTASKPGYQNVTVHVRSKLSGGGAVAGAGNIIAGGIIGGLVDGSNGSLNNLEPNPLIITLTPDGSVAADAPSASVMPEAAPAPAPEAAPAAAQADPATTAPSPGVEG
jgi:hypothetical protein